MRDDVEVLDMFGDSHNGITLNDINRMNIIINDADCMTDYINAICIYLENAGIKYIYTRDCKNIDVSNSVVVTLDQLYVAGPGAVIFAPLQNGRDGESDALALAVKAGLEEQGVLCDGIACGKMGFRENPDGTISERVPTQTEESITDLNNTSFVTLSLGTSNTDASKVATAISSALARFCSYTKKDNNIDLIHTVEVGQDYEAIAYILGSDADELDNYNKTTDEDLLLPGETIINPVVKTIDEFNGKIRPVVITSQNNWTK